jgi:hypothetical protein
VPQAIEKTPFLADFNRRASAFLAGFRAQLARLPAGRQTAAMAKVVTEASASMRLLRHGRPRGWRVRRSHGPVARETMGGALYVINSNFDVLAIGDSFFDLVRALGLARRGEHGEHEPAPRRRRRAAAGAATAGAANPPGGLR